MNKRLYSQPALSTIGPIEEITQTFCIGTGDKGFGGPSDMSWKFIPLPFCDKNPGEPDPEPTGY